MANSYIEYTANGSTTTFSIPFAYTQQADVTVFVGGTSTSFTFASSSTISLSTAPASGVVVRIARTTPITTRAVDFSNGAILTEADLDNSNIQVFQAAQEAIDTAEASIFKTADGKFDAQSRVIKNVADPVNAQDAVTKTWAETASTSQVSIATTKASEASASEVNALASKNAAAASAVLADADRVATNADVVLTHADVVLAEADKVQTGLDRVATNADVVLTNADVILAEADKVQTGLDRIATGNDKTATNADKVATNADVVLTHADVVLAEADKVQTALDRIATGNDKIATNADVVLAEADKVQTGLDRIATNADVVLTHADVVLAEADKVQTGLDRIATAADRVATGNDASNAASSLASFTGQYVSQSGAPSSPSTGDLWFDTSSSTMKVYNGSAWANAGSSVNGVENSVQHTATAGQTSFAATYDAGYLQVFLNGIRLDAADYTATNGTAVVLAVAAAVGDTVFIQGFGTFVLANVYTKTASDARFKPIGASSGGPSLGTASVIRTNAAVISESITINTNGMSAGPITIADGHTITIGNSGNWSIV